MHRGSFRTGSTGSWEPVNFEESYAEVKKFDKKPLRIFENSMDAEFRNLSIKISIGAPDAHRPWTTKLIITRIVTTVKVKSLK